MARETGQVSLVHWEGWVIPGGREAVVADILGVDARLTGDGSGTSCEVDVGSYWWVCKVGKDGMKIRKML